MVSFILLVALIGVDVGRANDLGGLNKTEMRRVRINDRTGLNGVCIAGDKTRVGDS